MRGAPLRGSAVLQSPASAVCRAFRLLLTKRVSLGGGRGEHGRALLREPVCHNNLAPTGALTGQRVVCTQHVFSSQYYLRPTVHHLLSGRALRLQLFYTSAHASRCNSMEYCVAAIVNSNDMQSPWPAMDNAYLLIACYPPRLPTIRYPLMQHYPTLAWTSFKV